MARGRSRKELAIGAVDGVNATFRTTWPYEPGTLKPFLNGWLLNTLSDNGFDETDPSSGIFDLKIPPRATPVDNPDVVYVLYTEG
jgi:hypothetical protein